MSKIKIIALVGMSGTGKTMASQYMGWRREFNTIVSYTTRPKRKQEIDGIEHWFVSLKDKPSQQEMVAYTIFGGYEYWTTWDQFSKNLMNVYVIDEYGLMTLESNKDFKNKVDLTTVKIIRKDTSDISKERKDRDKERVYVDNNKYDYIINNDGTLREFMFKIEELCNKLKHSEGK